MAHHRGVVPLVLALVLLLALFPTQTVSAATYSVNTTNDTADASNADGICADAAGRCSLRAAIMEANTTPATNDIINLAAGTYTLTIPGRDENNSATGDLDILGPVTITGSGGNVNGDPAATIIQAGTNNTNGIDKVMSINPYFNTAFSTTLRALTIRYGYNTSSDAGDGYGGGLDWDASGSGRLTIDNCVISDNTTVNASGGGLFTSNVDLTTHFTQTLVTISRSTFNNNHTLRGDGGGLFLGSNVTFSVTDSTISNNSAASGPDTDFGRGGGIMAYSSFAVSTISGTTANGNTATGRNANGFSGSGGGINANGVATIDGTTYTGYIRINNSTISGNSATGYGGGGWLDGIELNNVTITGNRANASSFGSRTGGAIHSYNSYATYLRNTIAVGNFNGPGSTADDLTGTYAAGQSYNNLVGVQNAGQLGNGTNGNQVGVANPRLGPLASNGGPTQTHALLVGSPALDAGNNTYAQGSYDQRGNVTRILDAADANTTKTVDIGAFEAYPSIEDLPDRTIPVNSSGQYEFQYGDSSVGTITFAATSSNATLVPNNQANLSVDTGSTGGTRVLGIAPVANQVGTTTITVTATASTGQSVSDSFVVTVPAAPDLVVTKTHTGSFIQGQSGTYTLTVRNQGVGSTSGTVTLTDTLPAGLTATGMSGTGWTCTLATLTCNRSDALGTGASFPAVTLSVTVSPTAQGSLVNTASVSNASDANTGNNTGSDTVTVVQVADLTVSKTHAGIFRQGQSGVVYTLTVQNAGGSSTSGAVSLTDTLPAGLTATGMSGTGWTCTLGTLTCTRSDSLAAGASYPPVTLTVNVAANAPTSITNTAQVSGGGESNTANNTASDPAAVDPVADMTITAGHSGDFRQGQAGALYTLTVTNSGAGPTLGSVSLAAVLPQGLTASNLSGSGWTCDGVALTCARSDTLAAGASYPPVNLVVDVSASAQPLLTLTASVSGGGELNTANNTASHPANIIQVADLTVSKTHSGAFYQGQHGAAFTLTVTNAGPGPTTGQVTLTDTLPASLTASALSGSGWNCDLPLVTCTRTDVLAAGASYPPVTLLVDVSLEAPGSETNQAQVSGGGELVTTNDAAGDTVTITPLPDLVISKSHTGDFRQGQAGAAYHILVTNSGHAATGATVSVTDTLPAGLTATSLSGAGWNCALPSLTCTRGDALAAGASYPEITLTVSVAADAPASLTNQASVSGGSELSADNNTTSDLTTILQAPDLVVSKSHTGVFKQGQSGDAYTLTVSNTGRGPTSAAVLLEDLLPAGLTATGLDGAGWACQLSTLTCQRADVLPAGASFPAVTLTVDVAQDAASSLTNTARVSGGGELNTGNNEAGDLTVVYTRPVVTQHPANQSAWTGQTVTFHAAASGLPAPTIQWQVSSDGGASWTDLTGETSTNLSFTAAVEQNDWQYRAVFTNEMDTAVTDAAALSINYPPVFTQHPLSQIVRAGKLVTLRVAVSARPEASVHWQVSPDGGFSWTDIPGASGIEYSFRAYRPQDGYQYRAVAVNDGATIYSDPAVITVEESHLYFPLLLGQ